MKSKDMSGVLFKNDKATTEKHPGYKGKCTVAGVEYWLAGWVNENDRGKYFSLKFEPVEEKEAKPDRGGVADMQDDIPF